MATMTLEIVSQRVEALEKLMNLIVVKLDLTEEAKAINKKITKKAKKEKKSDDAEDKPKKKRVSGYLLFSSAMRDDVKKELFGDEKPKNSEIMVELGKRWKALSDEERTVWNEKAKEEASDKEASESED